jgi:AcrR family transcriptional regulator
VVTTRQLRADAARNRERVLSVARAQVDRGDLSLPMNTLAKAAGVGVGTVYRHFPTHATLLEAIAADAFVALVAEARAAAEEPDAAQALRRLLRSALELLRDDRGFAAVLASPSYECPETLDLGIELGAAMAPVLDRARRAHLIRADVGPDDLRRLICGVHHALSAGTGEKLDLYLDVLMNGLSGPPGRKARARTTAAR